MKGFVAGDHVSKSQESTGGDFGAPYCSLLFASNIGILKPPSGCELEVLDCSPHAIWYPIVFWRASKPSPRLRHPSPARGRGDGGEGATHCSWDEGIGLGVSAPRDGYRIKR